MPPNTVSVGKKSLKWIPLFGLFFGISGNIYIDRSDRKQAINSFNEAIPRIKSNKLNIWLFPEGTRGDSKALLPFKKGAFHLAIDAQVPSTYQFFFYIINNEKMMLLIVLVL